MAFLAAYLARNLVQLNTDISMARNALSQTATYYVKVRKRLFDDLHGFHQVSLGNNQWRGKTDATDYNVISIMQVQ